MHSITLPDQPHATSLTQHQRRLNLMQHGLSASPAAETLGMSRRNIISYRTASRPIPKVVKLACKAVDFGATL